MKLFAFRDRIVQATDESVRLIEDTRSKQNVPATAQPLEHFVSALKDVLKVWTYDDLKQ